MKKPIIKITVEYCPEGQEPLFHASELFSTEDGSIDFSFEQAKGALKRAIRGEFERT